ncbi:hypothetical protein CDL12_23184 [Handroanthus impetiginosus]|uniref:Aspartic peptidase DDI1-type domain-containing protein n=1 Tax=Handroanthus impetiginosus TaxID=429701 RepID=A0A2G9GGY7_9LAMI|nr:hypothetical protein CDL12_23184 [Handroanthus impetiginosus]
MILKEPNKAACGNSLTEEIEKKVAIPLDQSQELNGKEPKLIFILFFPEIFTKSRKKDEEKEILETFCKVEVNISLFEGFKQIPRYAKFLEDLCTNKRKLKHNERISNVRTEKAMCDIGASINVMPLSIYLSLNIGALKKQGVLEDVLVQANGLVSPADFYVLNMVDDNSPNLTQILLGRDFLRTFRTKIDMHDFILPMEFDDKIIKFDIYDTIKNSSNVSCVFAVHATHVMPMRVQEFAKARQRLFKIK